MTNTIEAVVSAGASVRRDGMQPGGTWGPWIEKLDVAGADLSRMPGAPLLVDHLSRSDFVIGTVDSARVENGQIVASLRFSSEPKAQAYLRDVRDKIRRQLSVGYNVDEWVRQDDKKSGVPTYTASRYQILEVSLVPVGADSAAVFRSLNPEIRTRSMTVTTSSIASEEAPVTITTSPDPLLAERERSAGIVLAARKLGVDMAVAGDLITRGVDLETARQRLLDVDRERSRATSVGVTGGADYTDPKGVADAIATAWAHRCNGAVKLDGRAAQYRGMRTAETLRQLLTTSGIRPGTTEREIVTRAQTTSDFPYLLASALNKALLPAYSAARSGLIEVARHDSVRDFKTASRLRGGEFPALLRVDEHGEYTYGAIGENRETFVLKKYGRVFAISWEAFLNDDLDALGAASRSGALAAASLEADLLAERVNSNPAMSDSVTIFHSTHGNVGTPGTISATTLGEATSLMRRQKGLDAATILNLRPKYLVVHTGIESVARQMVASITPATTSADNSQFRDLTVVVDPRLDATDANGWFLFADQSSPSLNIAFLEGEEGPVSETQNSFEIDAVKVKVRHVAAAYWSDFRPVISNAGA